MYKVDENLEELRKYGYKVVDFFIDKYNNSEEIIYKEGKCEDYATKKLPSNGEDIAEVFQEVFSIMNSDCCNVLNNKYFGYVTPRPLPISILGDYLAKIGNQTPGAWRAGPGATKIEWITLNWIAEFIGYKSDNVVELPPGIITSGATMANLTALQIARDRAMGDAKEITKVCYYISSETHLSVLRSFNMLGILKENIRVIECDLEGKIDVNKLDKSIEADFQNGLVPAAIVATYGTTTIGAIDDIEKIRLVANRYNSWLHVDAAAGGVYADEDTFKTIYGSINVADSVTIDPSKWLFLVYGVGCLLMHNPELLTRTYSLSSSYWIKQKEHDNFQMSFTGTRSWRTLGLYMALKHHGKENYIKMLNNLVESTDYFESILKGEGYEVVRVSKLPIFVFRKDWYEEENINWLLDKLKDEQIAYFTLATFKGNAYIRVAISNYNTTKSDIDFVNRKLQKFQCI